MDFERFLVSFHVLVFQRLYRELYWETLELLMTVSLFFFFVSV